MFDIWSAVILGFSYGLGPCTLSCAPFIVPLIMATAKNKKEGVIHSIIFGAGRVIGYVILGFFAGLLGKEINFFVSKPLLGLFFVLLGVFIFFNLRGKCLFKTKLRITGKFMALTSGIVYGLGPCPPLIALLGLAAASKSAFMGAMMGLVFGVGTMLSPIIILGLFSGWFAKQPEFRKIIPYVSGVFLVILGLIYVIF